MTDQIKELERELRGPRLTEKLDEMRKAVRCLYIATEACVAEDVSRRMQELEEAMDLRLSELKEGAR